MNWISVQQRRKAILFGFLSSLDRRYVNRVIGMTTKSLLILQWNIRWARFCSCAPMCTATDIKSKTLHIAYVIYCYQEDYEYNQSLQFHCIFFVALLCTDIFDSDWNLMIYLPFSMVWVVSSSHFQQLLAIVLQMHVCCKGAQKLNASFVFICTHYLDLLCVQQ